jgi:hypothetical protein
MSGFSQQPAIHCTDVHYIRHSAKHVLPARTSHSQDSREGLRCSNFRRSHPAIVLQLSATFGSSASKENAPPIKRVEGITYVRLQNISCRDFDLSVYLQCILELTDLINGSIEKFTSIFKACIPGFEDIVHFIFTQGLGLCFYMLFKFFDQDMRGNGVRAGRLWKA